MQARRANVALRVMLLVHSSHNDADMRRMVVEEGADPTAALEYSLLLHHPRPHDMVALFLSVGATPYNRLSKGRSLLAMAVFPVRGRDDATEERWMEAARLLLDHGVCPASEAEAAELVLCQPPRRVLSVLRLLCTAPAISAECWAQWLRRLCRRPLPDAAEQELAVYLTARHVEPIVDTQSPELRARVLACLRARAVATQQALGVRLGVPELIERIAGRMVAYDAPSAMARAARKRPTGCCTGVSR